MQLKPVYLTTEQIQAIEALATMRLTELKLAQENPYYINLYEGIIRATSGKG